MLSSHLQNAEFLWNNLVCQLKLENNVLRINCIKKLNSLNLRSLTYYDKEISLLDIVSIECKTGVWKVDNEKRLVQLNLMNLFQTSVSSCYDLIIHIALKTKNRQWKLVSYTFQTSQEKYSKEWKDLLENGLHEKLKSSGVTRPKKLLVFVNPYGGKRKAESVFSNVASRLFKLAGVEVTVEITQYRNYAWEKLLSIDFSCYDGIIAVGGDGMANEIINGVLIAKQKQNNEFLDGDPQSLLHKPMNYVKADIKIGLIPAGSTNCLSYVSQGVDDAETSTLQIICGESHPLDLCSIHEDNGKFVRFSFSMNSYGYFGQVLRKSETLRKFGPSRYDIAGINSFVQAKCYLSEVAYLPSSPDDPVDVSKINSKCRNPCETCRNVQENVESKLSNGINGSSSLATDCSVEPDAAVLDKVTHPDSRLGGNDTKSLIDSFPNQSNWKVLQGYFLMVNSAVTSCSCSKCPEGLSPSAHLADGNLDLILLRTSSRADLLRYLLSHIGKANRFDFPFVEVHRVRGFHHRAVLPISNQKKDLPTVSESVSSQNFKTGCWNSDGEIIENPNISLWVHRGLVNLFARGVE